MTTEAPSSRVLEFSFALVIRQQAAGTAIHLLPFVAGYSTTTLVPRAASR